MLSESRIQVAAPSTTVGSVPPIPQMLGLIYVQSYEKGIPSLVVAHATENWGGQTDTAFRLSSWIPLYSRPLPLHLQLSFPYPKQWEQLCLDFSSSSGAANGLIPVITPFLLCRLLVILLVWWQALSSTNKISWSKQCMVACLCFLFRNENNKIHFIRLLGLNECTRTVFGINTLNINYYVGIK